MKVKLTESWKTKLESEFEKDYFQKLTKFVRSEYENHVVYPPPKLIFNALDTTGFDQVKVVIIGQDPYHGEGQANGLSFSVGKGLKLPPSLQNIYKELNQDLGVIRQDGDLTDWARQGVLMLNATLTVRAKTPGSHQNKGWEEFTDAVISQLNHRKENLVFILWGKYAQNKGIIIDRGRHFVIESAHPSPFAAHRGFFGSSPFSKTNNYLSEKGLGAINW